MHCSIGPSYLGGVLFNSLNSNGTRHSEKNMSNGGNNSFSIIPISFEFPSAQIFQIMFELIEILSTVIARMQVSCQVILDIPL